MTDSSDSQFGRTLKKKRTKTKKHRLFLSFAKVFSLNDMTFDLISSW